MACVHAPPHQDAEQRMAWHSVCMERVERVEHVELVEPVAAVVGRLDNNRQTARHNEITGGTSTAAVCIAVDCRAQEHSAIKE